MTAEAWIGAIFLKPILVVAAAAAITACLRPHTAAARHAVWAAALLLVVVLPALGLALPPLRVPLLDGALTLPWRDTAPTAPSGGTAAGAPSSTTRALPKDDVLEGVLIPGEGSAQWLPEAIAGAWLLGVLALGLRRIVMERRLRRIVHRSQAVSNSRLERLFADAVRVSGIQQRVEIRLSDVVSTPAVTGGFRPVILLPTCVDTWPEDDVAAALQHELGHVARHDCLLNLAADVATAIYWCNPAVHVAARHMRGESERACDDRVLRGGAEPEDYARLLVDVARRARISRQLPV
ncbi:MAG TPA: M56 family metallopeptidase, partial [Candidatus Eisenbacteria bacterium]|nr:M56 family metallopeptidase [Candidatus Eisenbacteria bacterium]